MESSPPSHVSDAGSVTDASSIDRSATPQSIDEASWYTGSVSLSLPQDDDALSPLHCFMRRYCVEAFSATPDDVATPRYGKSHGVKVVAGQIGIRCLYCKHRPVSQRPERAVCFPSTLRILLSPHHYSAPGPACCIRPAARQTTVVAPDCLCGRRGTCCGSPPASWTSASASESTWASVTQQQLIVGHFFQNQKQG